MDNVCDVDTSFFANFAYFWSMKAMGPRERILETAARLFYEQGYNSTGINQILAEAKVAVSPGVGFGEYGDDHVRFALIENEERTRQAVRGIKDMFRKDGLL